MRPSDDLEWSEPPSLSLFWMCGGRADTLVTGGGVKTTVTLVGTTCPLLKVVDPTVVNVVGGGVETKVEKDTLDDGWFAGTSGGGVAEED
jgi:hypothetical protein